MNLIGLVLTRNHKTLDYIPCEAAKSLIPHCDQVVVVDMQSDDGSYEELVEFEKIDSRLRVVQQPWANPHNRPTWWVEALNLARTTFIDPKDWLIQLDADEVLADYAGNAIKIQRENKQAGLFKRLNFWKDDKHLAPENRYCGTMVARMGPANLYLPSDEPHPAETPNLRTSAEFIGGLEIYHYGALRDPHAFVRKSKTVQNAFFGSCDARILKYEGTQKDWREEDYFDLPLRDYIGQHPKVAKEWLRSRGYNVK